MVYQIASLVNKVCLTIICRSHDKFACNELEVKHAKLSQGTGQLSEWALVSTIL